MYFLSLLQQSYVVYNGRNRGLKPFGYFLVGGHISNSSCCDKVYEKSILGQEGFIVAPS